MSVSQNSANNQNPQHGPDNRIEWTNNNNYAGLNPNPFFPNLQQPNLFFPNVFPQFPFPPFPNIFPFQNNFPQAYPNYPTGPQINTNNNQGNGFVHPNQGPLPYPQPNINQGFPTPNTNYGNQPSSGQFPQTNVHQGIPTGNINRSPDTNNLKPNEGQFNFNQVTTTEKIQNKAGGPTTVRPMVRPSSTTIVNTIFGPDENDEGVDFQFPRRPDISGKVDNSSEVEFRTTGIKRPNKNNTRLAGSDYGKKN